MDLMNLFKPNQTIERISLKPKKTYYTESISSVHSTPSVQIQTASSGTDYAKKYIEEENEKALEAVRASNCQNDGYRIDEMSVGTVPTTVNEVENIAKTSVYKTFDFEYRPKDSLPIVQHRDEIASMIETHSITIIEGVTGCGKSTQVPQFILDSCYKQRKHCNIIVTQPRRIAALSIANRVSNERGWPLGTLVGCQVGMYRNISQDTRLLYCTTGILLRKLIRAKNMLEYTHVVLDEVHERDQEMDFLLLVIRKLVRSNSRQVKVILMSATFNVAKFSEYFSVPTESGFIPAPIVPIPKKRNFKVHTHYLCQLSGLGILPEISSSEPKITEKLMNFCIKLINVFDDIDSCSEYDIDDMEESKNEKRRYATLVFLPGIWEIEEMHNFMTLGKESSKWDIVILHSSITYEEQSRIFKNPPKGYRRIILSTNIAESSITIDDVKYVIDFCLTKQLVTDPVTNFQCLELTWASKANCEQRAGRAGRVMDGRVYRLVPEYFYEKLLPEGDPEIIRAPLENLILQTKLLDMGEPKAVLALAIDPPDLSNLERTILLLKESGGLLDKPNVICKFDGELTDLGRIMAALPIDIHLSKLIALGHVFNVLRHTIIMAASMALKSMFNNPFQKRMEAYMAKVHWADGSTSDCLAFLNAYHVWQREVAANRIKRKTHSERSWAARHFLQVKVIHEVDYLVNELTKRLERLGIKETEGPNKIVVDDVERSFILKIVIAGAFYPNYFVKTNCLSEEGDMTQGTKALGGLDPSRTVYLQGWKPDQPGRLYAKRIQKIFEDVVPNYDQTLIEFDGSSRVYVMFSDDKLYGQEKQQAEIPGKVSLSVYKALKLRKLNMELTVPVLDLKSAKQVAENLKLSTNGCSMFFNNDNYQALRDILPKTLPALPSLDVSVIPLKVIYLDHPGKFWVRINDDDMWQNMDKIESFLNDPKNITLKPVETMPKIGGLVAVRGKDKRVYRVIIEGSYKIKNESVANVFFIDYGFRSRERLADLKVIKSDHEIYSIRAQAFEATLTGVEPSKKRDAKGMWCQESFDLFNYYVHEPYDVYGTVYSVVDSVVSVKLTCTKKGNTKDSINLNDLLVKEGLAENVEENYLSEYNHKLRDQINNYHPEHREYLEYLQYDKNFLISAYPKPPSESDCRLGITLRGPFSPLEITLTSLTIAASTKSVNVENVSVNSILVDTDPDDTHERLIVASSVSQSTTGKILTLRNTTLMPNLPGLTALICMIFAPTIELRRSSTGSRYVGALCGLGYNVRTGLPLLQEHDLAVLFDTDINIEDMQNINRLRHWMNMGICVDNNETDNFDEQAIRCQHKVLEFLRKLTDRPMKSQKPDYVLNFQKWRLYDETLYLHPRKDVIKDDSIFPLHTALELDKKDEAVEDMTIHVRELRALAISDPRVSENIEIYCKLCDETVLSRESLRNHLFMKKHREREINLNIKLY